MITLNGLPISWDSFIQGICARRNLISFNRLWEECTQEEDQMITREDGSNRRSISHSSVQENIIEIRSTIITIKYQREFKIYPSNIRYYTCDDKGHYSKIIPETEALSTRSQTRKDIMLTPLKMMNQLIKGSEKKRKIP